MKIGFIGCGNMGKAIVEGLVDGESKFTIIAFDHNLTPENLWVKQTGVKIVSSEILVAEESDIIVLAVKPAQIFNVLQVISSVVDETKIIVSLAAGISIDEISKYFLFKQPIVRLMPNTAAVVKESMTAIMINRYVSDEMLETIVEFCEGFGKAELIDEDKIHAFIGVSGSSPAYFYEMLEALGMAGVKEGLKADFAYRYAAQAMLGAAKTYLETQLHPAILRDQVMSPGGTTIEAINVLEKSNFRGSVMEAVSKCSEKSRGMK